MKESRRWFLKALAALGLSVLFPGKSVAAQSESVFFMNMDALAETLMPGVDLTKVRETVSKRPETFRICVSGLEALERYSREKYSGSFHALDEKDRDAVLRWMDGLPKEKSRGFFFTKFRAMVIGLYYTSPEVWKTLRYNGPPQPKGFTDYHLPPEGADGKQAL
jgi:hypothetical protein